MPVDAIDPTWINAPGGVGPTYDSEELRRNLGFTLAQSGTLGTPRSGVITHSSTVLSLSGTNVQVNQVGVVVGTAKGAYVTGATATVTIDALAPADVTNPRRDRVVLEILDPDNGGSAGRKAQFRVITGTPSPTATSGGGYPALPALATQLGYVDVPVSGSPTLTVDAVFTAAAGGILQFRNATEQDAHTVQNAIGFRRDTGALMKRGASSWAPLIIDGGTAYGFVGNGTTVNYDFSGTVNVTQLHDGRKRVDIAVSMARAAGAPSNPMSSASQDMGVVLPSAAQGSANSIMLSCPLDNGVAGNTSTAQVFVMISPSTGKLFIWSPTSFSWVAGRVISINCTYYI